MGLIAAAAGVAFGLALIFLATFLATKDDRFDRVAEWSFVAFALVRGAAGGRRSCPGAVADRMG